MSFTRDSLGGPGAAITIHRDTAFETSTVISDPNRQYVIVVGKLAEYRTNYHTIIGGDFSLVQDVTLDRSSTSSQTLKSKLA